MNKSTAKPKPTTTDWYKAMRKKLCFNQNLLDFIEIFILMFVICNIILIGSSFVTKGHNRVEMLFTADKESVTKSQAQQAFTKAVPQIIDHCEKAFFTDNNQNTKNRGHSLQTHLFKDNSVFELTLTSETIPDQKKIIELSKIIPVIFKKQFYNLKNSKVSASLQNKTNNKLKSKKIDTSEYKKKLDMLLKEYPDFFRYIIFNKAASIESKLSIEKAFDFLSKSNNMFDIITDRSLKNAIDNINDSSDLTTAVSSLYSQKNLLIKTAKMHSLYLIVSPIYTQIILEGIKEETNKFNRLLSNKKQEKFYLSSIKITNTSIKGHFKKFFIRFSAIALFLSLLIFPIVSYSANSCKNN